MGTWFIVDPGLIRRSGHNYQMAARMREGLHAAGADVRILGNVDVEPAIRDELLAERIFSQSHYTMLSQDPYSGVLEDFTTGARRIAVELSRAGGPMPGAGDVVLLPTAGPREMLGLALFLHEHGTRPKVVAIFHRLEPPNVPFGPGKIGSAITRMATKALVKAVGPQKLVVGATNDFLARKLEEPLGPQVARFPVPAWYPQMHGGLQMKQSGSPVIGFLGHMRDNHGFRKVPSLVRELARNQSGAECSIHLGAVPGHLDVRPYRALQAEGLASVIEGWLDENAMADLFRSASLLVLPYDRVSYREMVSAVFSTAVAMGKPCVVPSGTWLSDQIEAGRGAGIVYEGEAVKDIVAAIEAALKGLPTLTKYAGARAIPWRESQSGDRLLGQLVGWACGTGIHAEQPEIVFEGRL